MPAPPLTWDLPLGRPPRIRHSYAVARHGERPVEAYRLSGFWCLNVYHGDCTWRIASRSIRLHRGSVTITPPERDHEYQFPAPIEKSWVHFMPEPGSRRVSVPAVYDVGPGFAAAVDDVALIARSHRSEPERAEARLWDLMWRLLARGGEDEVGSAPCEAGIAIQVERIVHRRITERIEPEEVAAELGRSVSQVNRLLRREIDRSLGELIASIRLDTAAHMLQHSDLPIGEIGARVGLPDPQRFNKVVRARFGMSPRALRRSMGSA